MKIIILLFTLIMQQNILAQDDNISLSAKIDYQQAFKANEHNISLLKKKERIYKDAQYKYKLAQDNLKSANEKLIESEANLKNAKLAYEKSREILKKFGEKLDSVHSNQEH